MIYFLFFIAAFFTGCQQGSSPSSCSQMLRINIKTDPQTLDPRKARDLWGTTVVRMLFEGLTRISQGRGVEMAVAESVDISEDGRIYTFHLRETRWADGTPLTAFDFMASWRSVLDPAFPTDIADQLYDIKNARKAKRGEVSLDEVGLRVPDEKTLIVELEHPVPYFLELVAMSPFSPASRQIIESSSDWALHPDLYVGNGPFCLSSWDHSNQIQLKKNPLYWEAQVVRLEGIELLMVPRDTEFQLFENKQLDWAGGPLSSLPSDAISFLKDGGKLHVGPFSGTVFFRVNTAEQVAGKKNPLSNAVFRQALAAALDRRSIVEQILQGGQRAAYSLVPPEMNLSQGGYFPDADPQKARDLLADALLALGLSRDQLEPITLSYFTDERNAAIAQAVQQQLKANLGIEVVLEVTELKLFFQHSQKGNYEIALWSWLADFNDPINFLDLFQYKDSPRNHTGWENAKYIDLLDRSALCKKSEERQELLRQAERILMEELPVIPLYHQALNYLKCEGLEGVALSPLGQIDFRRAYFDPSSR